MVQWGGTAQAWTLPIISLGTVYLVQRYVPKNMKATALMTWLLYAGAFVITAFVLVSEYRKYFLS
jgi:pheromone shutdown protein TraB